ncbi:MAG: MCP four helix bundle domain-containing protein, partial [Rhizobacter sp.]|nr:MCP four helix bundle domain-containing protein [Rhizobacter sp.]
MFQNMKVGTRLALGFGVVSLLLMVVATLALVHLSDMNENIELIVHDRYAKVVHMNTMNAEVSNIGRDMRNAILTGDANRAKEEAARVLASRKRIGEAIEQLDKTIKAERAVALLKLIKEDQAKFTAGQERVLGLVAAGKRDDATGVLLGELQPVVSAFAANVQALSDFQSELMTKSSDEAMAEYLSARNTTLALIVVALGLAAGVGYWITRVITRQLGGEPDYAAAVLARVAEGDLSVEVALQTGDDTSMLHAVKQTVGQLKAVIAEVGSVLGGVAQGDLTQSIEGDYKGEFAQIRKHVNNTIVKLSQVVTEVNSGAE